MMSSATPGLDDPSSLQQHAQVFDPDGHVRALIPLLARSYEANATL